MMRLARAALVVVLASGMLGMAPAAAIPAGAEIDSANPTIGLFASPKGLDVDGKAFSRSVFPAPKGWTMAQSGTAPAFVEGEVLVTLDKGGATALAAASRLDGARQARAITRDGLVAVTLADDVSVQEAVKRFSDDPGVVAVQPNYVYTTLGVTPNDPKFGELWGLGAIRAIDAWDVMRGRDRTIVAVIDSGVDVEHGDFTGNLWVNRHEVADNGKDDDGNGYVDDINGYDFVDHDGNPDDEVGHGTHVAGTVGARGNDKYGVVGVNWDVAIMALKVGDTEQLSTAAIVEAAQYAEGMGADVVNCSFGGPSEDPAFRAAIAASEALYVAAAGNSTSDNDSVPMYPAAWDLENILAVAATDSSDALAVFSNFGATSVDLAAPGVDIVSCAPLDRERLSAIRINEKFNSLGAWDVKHYWQKPWALTSKQYRSPSKSVGIASPKAKEWSWMLLKEPVNLKNAKKPYLVFSARSAMVEMDDFVHVWVSHDGVWGEYKSYSGGSDGWGYGDFDLTKYAGDSSVYFALIYASDSVRDGGAPGSLFVDDFTVYGEGLPWDPWYSSSGTSMAAPHASGAAALVKSYNPALSAVEIKQALMDSVDPVASLSGKMVTGGRLNVDRALDAVPDPTYAYVDRIEGRTRFAVGVEVARKAFFEDDGSWAGIENVIIASGDDRAAADPLAAAGLSWALDAPVFLVSATSSPGEVRTALKQIVTENGDVDVYVVGGKKSLPASRVSDVLAPASTVGTATVVKRYGDGVGRFDLAAQIAADVRAEYVARNGTNPPVALVANGGDPAKFFDALALSPIAAHKGYPIVLVTKDKVPASSAAQLDALNPGRIYVAGGTNTISKATLGVLDDLATSGATRLAGRTRYDTAVAIADRAVAQGWLSRDTVLVTAKLPDALVGGSMLGRSGAVLLLTDSAALSRPTDLWLLDEYEGVDACLLLGGANSLKTAVERRVRHCLQ